MCVCVCVGGGGYHYIYTAVRMAVTDDSVEHSPTSLCAESQSAISVAVQGQSWVDCSEGGGEGVGVLISLYCWGGSR